MSQGAVRVPSSVHAPGAADGGIVAAPCGVGVSSRPRSTAGGSHRDGSTRGQRASSNCGTLSLRRAVVQGQDSARRVRVAARRGGVSGGGGHVRARMHVNGPHTKGRGGEVILTAGGVEEHVGAVGRSTRGQVGRRAAAAARGSGKGPGKAWRGGSKKAGHGLSMVATFTGDAEMRARMEGIRKLQDETVAAETKGHRTRRVRR